MLLLWCAAAGLLVPSSAAPTVDTVDDVAAFMQVDLTVTPQAFDRQSAQQFPQEMEQALANRASLIDVITIKLMHMSGTHVALSFFVILTVLFCLLLLGTTILLRLPQLLAAASLADGPQRHRAKNIAQRNADDAVEDQEAHHQSAHNQRIHFLTKTWGFQTLSGLPVLDQNSVSANVESRLVLNLAAFADTCSKCNFIHGTDGNVKYKVEQTTSENGAQQLALTISSCPDANKPHVFVATGGNAASIPSTYEVWNAEGEVVATLQVGGNSVTLLRKGQCGFCVQLTDPTQMELVVTNGLHCLAVAGHGIYGAPSAAAWCLRVRPEVDATLIVACVVSMLCFHPICVQRTHCPAESTAS